MADVRVISPIEQQKGLLRIAAYCRVSSDSEDRSTPTPPKSDSTLIPSRRLQAGN